MTGMTRGMRRVMNVPDGPRTAIPTAIAALEGSRDERGFFERAGDEIASWFGDDEAERRRHQDQQRPEREGGWSSLERGSQRDRDPRTDEPRPRLAPREGRERGFFGGRRDEGDWNQPHENRSRRRETRRWRP